MSNNISELISKSNKRLTEISQETGIAYPTLSGYNQGIRTPKTKNAQILADYFGVSVPYLLGLDDKPFLDNPNADLSIKGLARDFYKILTKQSLISDKIDEWTPFKDELAVMIADFQHNQILENYIDFIAKDKGYNPILLKAYKQFVTDKDNQLFTFLINQSSDDNSPYHYVWQAWEDSDEYKAKQANKKK